VTSKSERLDIERPSSALSKARSILKGSTGMYSEKSIFNGKEIPPW